MFRLALLFIVAALAGCVETTSDGMGDHHDDGHADDHHGTSEDANLPYTGQEDVLVTIVAGDPDEFRFVPDNFTVQEGQSVGVTFRNDGGIPHEFSIKDYDFHIHLDPGEEAQGSFVADEEGTLVFGCYIPGHFESGMKGTMTVEHAGA